MSDIYDNFEQYGAYERSARAKYATRKQRRKPKPKEAVEGKSRDELIKHIKESLNIDSEFDMSYVPSWHEAEWVFSALRRFYEEDFISDVVALIKGGKEANVYQCRAHESLDVDWLALKIYRPRIFRNLRNDAMYREGRVTRGSDGKEINPNDKRTMKALKHKSSFGAFLSHQSWLQYEFQTLESLYSEGVPVPKPYGVADNAILMDFVGDENGAAPILQAVNLRRSEADRKRVFDMIIRGVEGMLDLDLIHGDLSAFNIMYWENEPVFIDFPQVITASKNRNAGVIFQRDLQRVCGYFSSQGLRCDAFAIFETLWREEEEEAF